MMSDQQRIDKWLWATRVFKTRSIAADACKKGRISMEGRTLKPSSMISKGDVIQVRKPPITLSLEVVGLLNNRVGPKLVDQYLSNVTPKKEYEILELQKLAGRQRGTGRPTKKERRDLDQFLQHETSIDWAFNSDEEDDEEWSDFWDE